MAYRTLWHHTYNIYIYIHIYLFIYLYIYIYCNIFLIDGYYTYDILMIDD